MPKYAYKWKTLYDRFHTYVALQEGTVVEDRKPSQAHLRAYGCKAFTLTKVARIRKNKKPDGIQE